MRPQHTDRDYEQELRLLRERLTQMGEEVDRMVRDSIRALVERDAALAKSTIAHDQRIDQLEIDTDRLCLRVLAMRQPVASDLRALTTAMKMVTDLERVGDLAVNICERTLELDNEPPLKEYIDIPRMAELVRAMLQGALDAFNQRDAAAARQIIDQDRQVDALNAQVARELLSYMIEDPRTISRATRIQSVARYLERIGDHATNLAEMVVFMIKGEDLRHSH